MSITAIPEPGAVLAGKFRVARLLGQGGMGAVLEAENTLTGKRVAIKWLSPLLSTTQGKERFLREAQAASRVRHPNVIDVYDFVHEGDRFFLVMELLDGEPLTALMERGGIPLHVLVSLLIDAMRGVAAAHAHGVIHRDIKPDNIFLERQKDRSRLVPKVIDFGVSKLIGDVSLTQSGTTVGTPLYMSYEQLRGAKDVDVRADVYSFGVILYEAMTGQPPYQADTLTELVVKITTTEPARAKLLRPELPTSLDQLIHWAMAIDRQHRLPSIEQMISELEPFASEHGFRAQMTLDGASMPRVPPSSDPHGQPETPTTQPRARGLAAAGTTPLAVSSEAAPRGSRRVWLAAALLAVLSLVVFAIAISGKPASTSRTAASGVQVESAARLGAAPAAEAPVAPAPSAQPEPQPQPPVEAVVTQPPSTPPVSVVTPPAAPKKPAKKRAHKPGATEEPKPDTAPPVRDGFRAGRPRSEDF